ncbi:hypothetical protein ACFFHI_07280 [Streptomyces palmae]|uniref:Uncharacterized protein n=1 Tax=Streptomyces palmae TaxID=1701085 RepID=A0A4Z0HBG5_9ACTN|nr:hypothetical protein E4099_14095 [Streptomyces palmae]
MTKPGPALAVVPFGAAVVATVGKGGECADQVIAGAAPAAWPSPRMAQVLHQPEEWACRSAGTA